MTVRVDHLAITPRGLELGLVRELPNVRLRVLARRGGPVGMIRNLIGGLMLYVLVCAARQAIARMSFGEYVFLLADQ